VQKRWTDRDAVWALSRVDPRSHVLDGVQIPCGKGQFLGARICPNMPDDTTVSCAQTAGPIEMPFGLWTWVGPRNRIRWDAQWHHLKNATEPFVCGGDAASLSNYFDHLLLLGRITVLRTQMWSIVTVGVECSVGLSVRLSVTVVSPSKTAELIEIPFGLWARVGSRNRVLDGGPDNRMGRSNFRGSKRRPIVKYRNTLR